MIEFKDYNPSNPWTITNESQVVDSSGKVTLNYIPLKGSITIPGYTETTSQSPGLTEFYVDYQDSTTYRTAKGILQFNASAAAQVVSVSYSGVSTVIWAKTLNEIKAFMESYGLSGVTAGTYQIGNYTVNAQGRVTAVEPVTAGMKNKLINGDFSIWQRGANAIPTVSRSRSASVYTITLDRPHGYTVGDMVQITGFGGKGYNYSGFAVSAVPSATTFQFGLATALSADITAAATTITVGDNIVGYLGDTLPLTIQCGSEQMTLTAVNGTTWTVTRGANSTTAAAHSSGALVFYADETTTPDTGGKCLTTNRPSFAIAAGGSMYTADRKKINNGTDKPCVVSRQSFTPGQTDVPGEPKYFYRVSFATAPTTGSVYIQEYIESVSTLASKNATVSYYAKAGATDTWYIYYDQYFGSGGSSNVTGQLIGNHSLTTAWAKKYGTALIPSSAGKTITTNDRLGLILQITPRSAATYDLALLQLEEGSVATPFESRHPATELALCQRYFRKSYNQIDPPGKITMAGSVSGSASDSYTFNGGTVKDGQMRTSATTTLYSPITGAASKIYDSNTASDVTTVAASDSNDNGYRLSGNGGATQGHIYSWQHTRDAEL